MLIMGIVGVLVFSSFQVDVEMPSHHDKYPESVFFLDSEQMSRIASDVRKLPLTRRGPVWADPVSSGVDGELFFPLDAGLSEEAVPLPLHEVSSIGTPQVWINYLELHPVDVDQWLVNGAAEQAASTYAPVLAMWSEELEGGYFEGDAPSITEDLRGMRTTFWVRVNEWGAPDTVLMVDTSNNAPADASALDVVKKLRWIPQINGRQGMISVDWKGGEGL